MQVSRLGNPLFNEVLIPLSLKDAWNAQSPSATRTSPSTSRHPNSGVCSRASSPASSPTWPRSTRRKLRDADLLAILLTGIPSTVVPGFAGNYTGATQADMLRLNVSIPPTPTHKFSNLGLIGGDVAGFPNGRRVQDDVATIELRAIAGATLPLVDPTYVPDGPPAQSPWASPQVRRTRQRMGRRTISRASRTLGFPTVGTLLTRRPRSRVELETMTSTHHHPEGHGHTHAREKRPGPSDAGSVVLDIGPGAGAAVILTPTDMNGLEIEYRLVGDPWEEKHMAVRERRGPGAPNAAIFGPLPNGAYEFRKRGHDGDAALVMVVAEGSVKNGDVWHARERRSVTPKRAGTIREAPVRASRRQRGRGCSARMNRSTALAKPSS